MVGAIILWFVVAVLDGEPAYKGFDNEETCAAAVAYVRNTGASVSDCVKVAFPAPYQQQQ